MSSNEMASRTRSEETAAEEFNTNDSTASTSTKTTAQNKMNGQDKAAPRQDGGGKLKAESVPIGITKKKEDNIGEWYVEVIKKAGLLDYSDISGCFIYNPPAWAIWENIKAYLDPRIKAMGVKNCSYPIFIAEKQLVKEQDHFEGFAAEVAWVTHGGKDQLTDRIAVRPTSEMAMYPDFAKKIRSHRDLPLKLNQWNNVVRWEFSHAIPFLRSREFFWQEGHTAHLTRASAEQEVWKVLDLYEQVYKEVLAVPVVKGRKTDKEKFAGAEYTASIEAFVPAIGRGIQAGTSHFLGQHFSEIFKIKVEDPESTPEHPKEKILVSQNSWGLSTRSIGVMIMVHSDNKGLITPPPVAEIQVIIIPVGITLKTSKDDEAKLIEHVENICKLLCDVQIRAEVDARDGYSPGHKFNDWEMKGVPLRLEVGPRDLAASVVTASRRDEENKKFTIPLDQLQREVSATLLAIHEDLFNKADAEYRKCRIQIDQWDDFVPAIDTKNVCLIRHCLGAACEDQIKEMSKKAGDLEDSRMPSMGAKSLCIPSDQPDGLVAGESPCTNPNCEAKAQKWVMFGRSY